MLAPKDYPQRIALMKEAPRFGIDQDQIADFLWLANARPDLKYLSKVVNNLRAALELARSHWQSSLLDEGIDWLPGLLAQLAKLLETNSLLTRGESSAMDEAEPPDKDEVAPKGAEKQIEDRFDWLVRNAFYAAMCFSKLNGDDALREHYRLLQAHFALAHFHLTRTNPETTRQLYEKYGESSEWPAIKISPQNAGRAVRNLAQTALWANDILYRMQLARRPTEFASEEPVRIRFFKRFERKKNAEPNGKAEKPETIRRLKKSWTENRVSYICNYLSQAYGLKSRRHGGGGAPRIYIYSMGDPDDTAYDLGDLTNLDEEAGTAGADGQTGQPGQGGIEGQPQAGEEPTEDERLAADDCPGEDDGEEDTLVWTPGDDTAFERSPGSFGGCLRTVTHHLIREAKSFAFGYEHLAAYELRWLQPWDDYFNLHLSRLLYLPSKQQPALKGDPFLQDFSVPQLLAPIDFELILETRLLLITMLWTGSTIERAISVIWNEQLSATPCGDMEIATGATWRDLGTIRVRVPFPRYRQVQEAVPGLDCERKQYLVLPDPGHLSHTYKWWMQWRKKRYDSTAAFGRELGDYRAAANSLLQVFDPTGRLTLSKIAGTLYGQIMARTGNDAVAAAMITGQVRRGARVPMFYACRAEQSLQRIYQESLYSLRREIIDELR